MRSAPELMTKAIIIHNNLVRRAMWANFGTSIETEGGKRGLLVCLQNVERMKGLPCGGRELKKGKVRRHTCRFTCPRVILLLGKRAVPGCSSLSLGTALLGALRLVAPP